LIEERYALRNKRFFFKTFCETPARKRQKTIRDVSQKNLEQAQKNENIFAEDDILFSKAPKQTNMAKSILAKSK